MKKRLLPILLVCCLLSALLAVAAQADDVVASGDCGASGSSVKWTLDSNGVLTISGKGAMAAGSWYEHKSLITSLIVNNGVTEIGDNSFQELDRLTKVTLPDGLLKVNAGAFQVCSSLTKITLPNSVFSIGDYAFARCSNLVSFTMSDNVTSIGSSAFTQCKHLTKITLPKSVQSVGDYAFYGCDKLQSVTILGEISTIKRGAFFDCPALTEITIPDSVLIVEENAFYDCTALKDVYFTGTESMWNEISVDGGNTLLENATIHYNTSIEATYRINALSVSDTDGKPLTAIPKSSCLVTVSVTNRASGGSPVVFLASYDANGKYQGMMYVTVKEPVGGTVEVALPVDNSAGNIAQFKAFAVKSLSGLEPIGDPVSFPAQ